MATSAIDPWVCDRLATDPQVSAGGINAMPADREGLTVRPGRLEVYVHEEDTDDLISRYRMREDRGGQVYLISVPSSVPPELAPDRGSPVPAPAAAADLLEEKDPRARHAGAIELQSCLNALHTVGWLKGPHS
jgi:hypothetical protein